MPVDKKEVKEFEDKYKKVLFEQVDKLRLKQTDLLIEIEKMVEFIDLEKNLPNIGITLNNKFIELQHKFEDAGISIYSQKIEDYGPAKLNFVSSSILGQAIIYDLIDCTSFGIQELADYDKKMKELTQKRKKQIESLKQKTSIKRFWARLKSFFVPLKQEDFGYTKEETDEVNSHLLEYKEIDNKLWKYNLKDNVISSIVKIIRKNQYSADVIPGLLEESINPDLKKLGLGDLIPQLQQALKEQGEEELIQTGEYKRKDDEEIEL